MRSRLLEAGIGSVLAKRGDTCRANVPNTSTLSRLSLELPGLAKAASSLTLRLFARGEKLGEIMLGRGSLYWYGRYRQNRKRISWTRFADMMDELAYGKR